MLMRRRNQLGCLTWLSMVYAVQDRAGVWGVSLARTRRGRKSHATRRYDRDDGTVSDERLSPSRCKRLKSPQCSRSSSKSEM
jgi:hypothetical protein